MLYRFKGCTLLCIVDMIDIDRLLIGSCIRLYKKKDLEIYIFFFLRKLSRLRDQFCSTALVQSNIWHKKCTLLAQYYKIDLLIEIEIDRDNFFK